MSDRLDGERADGRSLSLDDVPVAASLRAHAFVLDEVYYRAAMPAYADEQSLLNGRGGLRFPGRWHRRGIRTVYTSESPESALSEALARGRLNRLPDERLLPLVICAVRFRLRLVVRLTDVLSATTAAFAFDAADQAVTRAIGTRCFAAGVEAMIVPSRRVDGAENLVVFPANLKRGSLGEVADTTRDSLSPRRIDS